MNTVSQFKNKNQPATFSQKVVIQRITAEEMKDAISLTSNKMKLVAPCDPGRTHIRGGKITHLLTAKSITMNKKQAFLDTISSILIVNVRLIKICTALAQSMNQQYVMFTCTRYSVQKIS